MAHVPREIFAAECWEQRLCDASKPVQVTGRRSIGAHCQLRRWMRVGGMMLLGFAIMTTSHLSLKGYERCKISDAINADCSGLTNI